MTHAELEKLLQTAGFPVAYHHFNAPPDGIFLVYLDDGLTPFFADNRTYAGARSYRLELYSAMDPEDARESVASVLDAADIPYTADTIYVESERLFETIFEIEV